MDLFLTRHGQTDYNAKGIVQGPRIDSELNEVGLAQASDLAAAFHETALETIYTSPLRRARATAEIVSARQPGAVDVEVVPELYEMDWGSLTGRRLDEYQDVIQDVTGAWDVGRTDVAWPGGESPFLVQTRIRPFASSLAQRIQAGAALVVAHGRVNRILLCELLGRPLTDMGQFPQPNGAITHLQWRDGWKPIRIGDASHLHQGGQTPGRFQEG